MPKHRCADYTQAMMDLGATLCTRGKPECNRCPIVHACQAHKLGIAHTLPLKKAARQLPVRTATFLLLKKGDQLLLGKRPTTGIWGGLWSVPEIQGEPEQESIEVYCQEHFNIAVTDYETLKAFRHTFTHYHLDIFPVVIQVKKIPAKIMAAQDQIWYNPESPTSVGLPKPIQLIMRQL
jgi:A/G-specific adenine glycosylase